MEEGGVAFMEGETGDDTFGSAADPVAFDFSPGASPTLQRQLKQQQSQEQGDAREKEEEEEAPFGHQSDGKWSEIEPCVERVSCLAACGGGLVVLGTELLGGMAAPTVLAAETPAPNSSAATTADTIAPRGRIFSLVLHEPALE